MGEPRDILDFVFDKLFHVSEAMESVSLSSVPVENDDKLYTLNDRSVCRLVAFYLLSHFDKMSTEQFEQVVTESLPEGVTWSYEHVEDCLITIEAPQKNREIVTYVKYF